MGLETSDPQATGASASLVTTLGRSGRSMFGKQADSKKSTAPFISFKGVTRDQAAKPYISAAHSEVDRKCTEGPGAIYDTYSSLSPQVEASKTTAPKYGFGTLEKMKVRIPDNPAPGTYETPSAFGEQFTSPKRSSPRAKFLHTGRDEFSKQYVSSDQMRAERLCTLAPPVGTYQVEGAVGKQSLSPKRTAPSYSLPRSEKLKAEYERIAASLPPSTKYETWQSFGKQPLSPHKTAPNHAFGSSSWDKEDKRFITGAHTRALLGTFSPNNFDHQSDNTISGFGKQSLSSKSTPPTFGFGSTAKMIFKTSGTPGPGAYEN